MIPIKTQAIQTALMGDWNAAIALNEELLAENPDDIDTLNRLAFAYMSAGKPKEAKQTYQRVLDLDKKNPIAIRNLNRLNAGGAKASPMILTTNLFIEESGKTKVIDLLNVADKKVLSLLRSGEKLLLSVKRMKLFLYDESKQYIGMLPDDLSKRLIKFINGGNEYDAYIKTVNNLHVTVFVREIKRVNRFKNQPSFPSADKTKFVFDVRPQTKNHAKSEDHEVDDEDTTDDSEEELL